MLTGGDMPEYLFRRTGGVVGLLRRLIEDGCARAIATGEERLTRVLLAGAAQPEPVRGDWATHRANTWGKFARPGRIVHYAELRKLLIEHADHLAARIDRREDIIGL
jgi:hypothetical protein